MIVTRKEVAELAGVSEATVSRVFNGVGPIKEATQRRVLEAAKQLNYHPNALAQSFARRRSGNIGVVVPFVPKVHVFSTYYFSEILSGIGQKVKEKGYDLLLLFRSPDEEVDYSLYFRTQKVDGCIILGARNTLSEKAALELLSEHRLPFCLVNQHFAECAFNEVDADHIEGSYSAVNYLISKGFRSIAFLNGPLLYSNSADRFKGYKQALQEAGLPVREALIFEGNYSRKSGYEAASRIWQHKDEIDAVFAANDRMAIGLMQGLRELGWKPGHDLAIVGYDNSDAASFTDPPLTTVDVPFYEMGRLAIDKLIKQITDSESAQPCYETLKTRLIVRSSSELASD